MKAGRLVTVVTLLMSCVGCVVAQPQAPIVWGEARWAYLAGWPGLPQITTLRVIPMGDTLLFTALNVASPVSDTILVCSSFDNGQTFTPWIPISDGTNSVSAFFTGSAGRFYAFFTQGTILPDETWLRVSADGGVTWGTTQQYRTNTYVLRGFAVGNEVLAVFRNSQNNNLSTLVIRSTDFGQSWSAPVVVDTADFFLVYYDQSIAFTETHALLIEEPVPSRWDTRLYVAKGDSTGQNWSPFEILPCSYYAQYACQEQAAIIGDTSGEAAGVLGVFGVGDFSPDRPLHYRTSDVSLGWESCVALTEDPHVIPWWDTAVPLNIGQGKLWLVGWERYNQPHWNYLDVRFSANHGKNWYRLQVAADSLANTDYFSGQIRENLIDLYWAQGCCGQAQP